jgi:cell division protein FtsN
MNKFLIGLVLGIAVAGGLAYYLNNAPSQFVNKVTNNNSSDTIATASGPMILQPGTKLQQVTNTSPNNGSANSDAASAPKYDFYAILPGKKSASSELNASASSAESAKTNKYYVQAGAFTDPALANNMKARLALLGFASQIRSSQNNNVVVNQIILGPFSAESEAESTLKQLTDNKIDATIIQNNNN